MAFKDIFTSISVIFLVTYMPGCRHNTEDSPLEVSRRNAPPKPIGRPGPKMEGKSPTVFADTPDKKSTPMEYQVGIKIIDIDQVALPAIQFKKLKENSYIKYKLCSSTGRCHFGQAIHETHVLRSLPKGELTLFYRTCQLREGIDNEAESCSTQSRLTFASPSQNASDSPLWQLLGEQQRLEAILLEKAKKIKQNSIVANSLIPKCKIGNRDFALSEDEQEKLQHVAELSLEKILAELSIAGDFGILSDLAKDEGNRIFKEEGVKKENERHQTQYKNATLNLLNGVLVLASLVGTSQIIYSTADWHRFVHRQHVILDSKESKHHLTRDGKGPFFSIKEGPYLGYKFLEDPQTRTIYLYSQPAGSSQQKFHTENDLGISEIKLDPDSRLTSAGLIMKDNALYLPHRSITPSGEFGFGETLRVAKINKKRLAVSREGPDDLDTRNAKREYFRLLSKYRHKHDPLRKTKSNSKALSRSLLTFSIMGSLAGSIVASAFFAEGFQLVADTEKESCQKLQAQLRNFYHNFIEANAIYTKLLEVKLEISITI